jgi:hypothetical protein
VPDFSGVQEKFGRALHHYDVLDRKLRDFRDAHPYSVTVESNADSTEHIVNIGHLEPPPIEFSLIAGDCLFNLRSALDHLICALWLGNVDTDRPEYPICTDHQRYWKVDKRGEPHQQSPRFNLRKLPDRERATIDEMQPCNRVFGFRAVANGLAVLHDLQIIDKHRRLNPVHASWQSANIPALCYWYPVPGALESNAEIGRYLCRTPFPEMNMDGRLAVEVAIKHRGGFPGLRLTLWKCLRATQIVLTRVSMIQTPYRSAPETWFIGGPRDHSEPGFGVVPADPEPWWPEG